MKHAWIPLEGETVKKDDKQQQRQKQNNKWIIFLTIPEKLR